MDAVVLHSSKCQKNKLLTWKDKNPCTVNLDWTWSCFIVTPQHVMLISGVFSHQTPFCLDFQTFHFDPRQNYRSGNLPPGPRSEPTSWPFVQRKEVRVKLNQIQEVEAGYHDNWDRETWAVGAHGGEKGIKFFIKIWPDDFKKKPLSRYFQRVSESYKPKMSKKKGAPSPMLKNPLKKLNRHRNWMGCKTPCKPVH